MGRRNRDAQQARRRAAAARGRQRPVRFGETGGTRYVVDLLAILAIALIINLILREAGVINALLRIIIALVAGRLIVSAVRRRVEARA